jgi:protein CpxP
MSRSVVLRLLTTALMLAAGLPADVHAQGTPPRTGMRQGSPRMSDQQREELEKRFTKRIDDLVAQRLRLSEEQQVKLRDVASRTEQARRVLRREEFALRTSLRDEMQAGDKASEAKVSDLLEQMPRLERRKLDLLEAEQRDLAKFLSPIQRARYFGLQDELRRGMQDLQRRRMGMDDSTAGPPESRGAKRRGPPPAA